MADENRAQDTQLLIAMLTTIETRLHVIVFEPIDQQTKFRLEFVRFLPGPWKEVEGCFAIARNMFEHDDVVWHDLDTVGMTGVALRWKNDILDETVKQGGISRFFKIANSILGSLAKVIPPLEFVKEYKEIVEGTLKYLKG